MIFDKVSVMPTERSSKWRMRKINIINSLNRVCGKDASQRLVLGNAWEALGEFLANLRAQDSLDDRSCGISVRGPSSPSQTVPATRAPPYVLPK
jgi:hypothetical protein